MEIAELPKDKKIILFDGICNLCNSTVQLIIQKDINDVFRFVQLQSDLGQKITKHIGVDTKTIDSILLYEPGKAYYYKAEAVLKIAETMGGMYSLLTAFTIIPKSFSNYIYDFIAKNRYKWYGKNDSCMIPTPELQSKFLE